MQIDFSTRNNLNSLLAHALRHDPDAHFLDLDADGWASVEDVLLAIRCHGQQWRGFPCESLETVIRESFPRRFEIEGGRIRALYGHSLPFVETGIERIPPTILFHGTTEAAYQEILLTGLRPMGRKMVHLTADREYALRVGEGKAPDSALCLVIQAQAAFRAGHRFLQANNHVWLTSEVPSAFVELSRSPP